MDFFEVIKNRQSIREFQDREVEKEKVEKILEAANSAPSAGNLQAYEIFIVRDKEKRRWLSLAAGDQEFIEQAPLVFVFCANPERSAVKYGERGKKLYSFQDATIAASFAILSACALGLGTCWVGSFSETKVRENLEISNDLIPVAIVPLGYPAEKPKKKTRRSLSDMVRNL